MTDHIIIRRGKHQTQQHWDSFTNNVADICGTPEDRIMPYIDNNPPTETEITYPMIATAVDTFLDAAKEATTTGDVDQAMHRALHAALQGAVYATSLADRLNVGDN